MKSNLHSLQKLISLNTVELANKLLDSTNEFINEFDQKDFFKLSTSKETLKKYEESFFSYLLKISPAISELTNLNAELASLLIKADKAMDIELIVASEKCFNAFEEFEKTLYEYTSGIENSLSNASATAASIITAAQKFKIVLQKLISENE